MKNWCIEENMKKRIKRIKELEEILKDRVATKNGRIVDLNKQLLSSKAWSVCQC